MGLLVLDSGGFSEGFSKGSRLRFLRELSVRLVKGAFFRRVAVETDCWEEGERQSFLRCFLDRGDLHWEEELSNFGSGDREPELPTLESFDDFNWKEEP